MMEQAANSKQQIGRACNLCRLSHTACESTRPCRRCVAIGKAHLCADVEMRKRGRPRKSGTNGHSNSKHHSSKGKNSSSSTRPPSASAREESGTGEWQSAATASTAKRPRIEPADGFKIRMPSLAFDPFDPFQVSAASTTASASSSSLVSVSRSAASNLHSHSERISNISSSFFGLAESSLSTGVPREAFSSSFSYSLHGLASSSSSSSSVAAAAHLSGSSSSSMSFDISSSSSSSSSSSPPSSPYSSPSSSPLSSFESSSQSLLSSLSSTLLRAGSGANAADRKREDVLEGILSLVLEELREVKQHNREMRKQLNKVVKRQNKTEQQLSKITATPSSSSASSSLSASSIPSAPSSASSSSNSAAEQTLSLSALSDILNRMPFLLDYTVSPSTFVVNDARKPFYALRVISQYIGEDSSPPIFIFVNNSFAELSGYALNELLGRNVNKVTCVDEQAKREMLSKLFQSAPQTISEPFALQVMMRRKDGRVFRCESRHQAFYNELGYIRWCVTVVDSYTELDIRGEDLSLDWTPPIAWAQTASSNRPSSAASTSTPAFSSSPASSSSPSAPSSCTTPGSENPHAHFASPPPRSALPNMNSYPTFNQQPQAAAFDTHQAQNHQQQHNSSIPSYPPSSSSTAPAPSPLFSGADDRIDLQELLLQLIPPSPSLPSYSMPSTPSSGASSLSTSSSSVGASTSSANPISSNQQPPGSGGDYSWLKELQQAPPAAQPQQQQQNSSWFDTDA